MKKTLSKLLLLLVAFTMFYCSDEQIAPRETGLTDDPATSIAAYSSNVFAIEITTMTFHPDETRPAHTEMYIAGSGGQIRVNWGDGTIEKFTLTPEYITLSHQYERVKNYTVVIDRDIKNIEVFDMAYDGTKLRNLHLSGLTNLKNLSLVMLRQSPEVINLSHNKLIEEVDLVDMTELRDLIIPTTNKISRISITGCIGLSTAVVDRVVDRVYQSAVSNQRTGGYFSFAHSWWEEEPGMVGPPSSYSLTKLRKLRDNYGWGTFPEFE